MLYAAYEMQAGAGEPFRFFARSLLETAARLGGLADWPAARHVQAALELIGRAEITHARPDYAISSVNVDGREVPVREEVAEALPFCNLLHFSKPAAAPQPRVLVVAPLSGHFATLLRGTVATLLRDHDVYITDWVNARDVPVSAGAFGFDDYVDYLIRFMETIGPGAHMLAVCQPCVQALVAAAVMAEDRNPAQPLSMTLMAGPIDTRESPTAVNELAMSKPIEWFKRNLLAMVPFNHRGAARRVYPGFLQLIAFMAMNPARHHKAHSDLYWHIAKGETAKAEQIKSFYDEYFAVLDLTAEFYIETVEKVFQQALLPQGLLTFRGRPVHPGRIRRTALLTVEGGRDDICAIGQTAAAHDLCSGLRPHLKRHHLQANVGHYGVFNGRRWEAEIYPVVRNWILSME
jgi:poly(3-hydroxybutyrate) depolymerase